MLRKTALIFTLALLLTCFCQPAAATLVNPYVTYSYDQMLTDVDELKTAYPDLLRSEVIGSSVDGRELIALRLGKGERVAIICAAIHGRENITTNFIMDMVERYCQGYVTDSTYQGLSYRKALNEVTLLILPMVNPDGVSLAQFGLDSVSPGRQGYVSTLPLSEGAEYGFAAWKANLNGVDLNRNFPWKWQAQIKGPQPSSAYHEGPYPLSEPETQAVARVLNSVNYYMLVSLHTMGQVVYWLDTDTLDLYDAHYPIAKRFASTFGYTLLPPEDTTHDGGFLCNDARYNTRRFCMTVELCPYIDQPPYPTANFDATTGSVYPLGLILADEVMKLPQYIRVTLDGKEVVFPDQQPVIQEGRTLTPLRQVLETCGISVAWDAASRQVTASNSTATVLLKIDDPTLYQNGQPITLEAPPIILHSRTLLPLRAVMEAFGYQVQWDGSSKTVSITSPAAAAGETEESPALPDAGPAAGEDAKE